MTAAQGMGIDVSHFSGPVDWAAVKAQGYTYGFVKATQGQTYKDPLFDAHWSTMRAAGVTRGAYHFYVTHDDPAAQAAFFINTVTLGPGDFAPVVDIEALAPNTVTSQLAANLQRWLDLVEAHYGAKPIIYTSPGFWNANLPASFGSYPLWIAEYGVAQPKIPHGWTTWQLWQSTENARVAGVASGADLNQLNPSGGGLSALLLTA